MAVLVLFVNPTLRKNNISRFLKLSFADKKITISQTLIGGILLSFNWFFFIYAMNHISIKAASYAYLICPIITTVLAYFILKEKLSKQQWLAVLISLISCIILAFNHFVDLLYSLIVALSYAFYLITQRNNNHLDKFFILAIQLIFAALCLIPYFPFYVTSTHYELLFYIQVLVLAIIFTILPLWLNLFALKGVNSSTMGILLYINPILNFIVAALLFHEKTEFLQIVGYFAIFVSIVLFNLARLKTILN
jgi:chloramphenicol-sensitive protein RarD